MKRIRITAAMALALGCAWTAHAQQGEPGLRLPGGAESPVVSLARSGWMQDFSSRLASVAASRPVAVAWRTESVSLHALAAPAQPPVLLDRTRLALLAVWQPWSAGDWHFGAAMGLRGEPSGARSAAPDIEWMPLFSFAQTHYRVNLGLLPPQGERSTALLLGMSIPLR
ncbi:MAG TPA: hypothetical protein PKC60_05980 [Hydrogenophaga sp.]|uniref:hypothetical protein n=1 Tax=Hydrogenophaga sp. TaxID=1904254 RepID=UPI002CB521F4|nr:hypothetical protein [Hydrogenophaga sp.]HMN92762.1 hypothetical protein [Hydrogenophaga sp.]